MSEPTYTEAQIRAAMHRYMETEPGFVLTEQMADDLLAALAAGESATPAAPTAEGDCARNGWSTCVECEVAAGSASTQGAAGCPLGGKMCGTPPPAAGCEATDCPLRHRATQGAAPTPAKHVPTCCRLPRHEAGDHC